MSSAPLTLTLTAPHTHAGRTYAAGDALTVEAATARWLLAQGVAEAPLLSGPALPAAPLPEPQPEPQPEPRPERRGRRTAPTERPTTAVEATEEPQ